MKLYWVSGSPFAWRAMLALILKGVEFEDKLLQISEREHRTPDYLKINPRGKVPALVDGDVVVAESLAILEYIERKVPSPPLYGETAAEHGRIAQLVHEHDAYLGLSTSKVIRPIFFGKADERADSIRESLTRIGDELNTLERRLAERPDGEFLAASRVSAADIVHYPTFALLERCASKPAAEQFDWPKLSSFPNLHSWRQRFAKLPGIERAYPPHWG